MKNIFSCLWSPLIPALLLFCGQAMATGLPTLVWNDAVGNGQWDVQTSANWSNATTQVAEAYFSTLDFVVLDDSITNASNPITSIELGAAVIPTLLSNNSTTNFTISGAGKISGLASIVKMGTSTLTISTSNDFTGNVTIAGGTLKAGAGASLGASNGTVYVTNGATLDIDYNLAGKPLVISGAGVGGLGALVNNDPSGTPISDNPGGPLNVTLAGNTTLGGSNRFDFGQISPNEGFVHSASNYSLTVVGTAYREWDNVSFDASFGNINVMTTGGGAVAFKGLTTLGNPASTLAVFSNAIVELVHDVANVTVTKNILLYGGSTFQNSSGSNLIVSSVTLGLASGDNCTFDIGGASLTVNSAISGPGNLVKTSSSPLNLTGSNTYTGSTTVKAGTLAFTSPNNIASSAIITIASGATVNANGTWILAAGQTLQGDGNVTGNLTSSLGSTVAPGSTTATGTLSVSGGVSLGGVTHMKLKSAVSDELTAGSAISFGGMLIVSELSSNALVVGDTFTLFNASVFTNSFASIQLPALGSNLAWNISNLAINGTLVVVSNGTTQRPLNISQQPSSALNQPLGSNVVLCVTAQSSASNNLQYQWLRNGVIILPTDTNFEGANGACLSISGFQATDSGAFSVEVADGVSVVISQPAYVTADINPMPGEDSVESATLLPSTNQFTVGSSNTNAAKESGTPDIIPGDPGGSEIWFRWTAPLPRNTNGIVTFSTLGSGFDTTMGAYTGSSSSNLTQVPTVINDDDGAGYLNSQISFYALGGVTYLIGVDGFYGAQGNVVLSWTYSPGSSGLPTTAGTPLVVVASSNSTVILSDPWPNGACDWLLDGQVVATDQTSLIIRELSSNNVGTYVAGLVSPNGGFTVLSEPTLVEINAGTNGVADTNSTLWTKYLNAANHPYFQPAGQGQVIKLSDSGGYAESQTFNTTSSNGQIGGGNPLIPGPYMGDCPVWYSFVPAASGLLEVSTVGSAFHAMLAVYASPVTHLSLPYPGGTVYYQNGIDPSVYLYVNQGVTYNILVEGIAPAAGVLQLGIFLSPGPQSQNLSIGQSGSNFTISWPANLSGNLYKSASPSSGWTLVGKPPWPSVSPYGRNGPTTITYTTPISGTQSQFFYLGNNPPTY